MVYQHACAVELIGFFNGVVQGNVISVPKASLRLRASGLVVLPTQVVLASLALVE